MPIKGHTSKSNSDESIKETLESVVMAFVLAFVFRAYVVEAFVIPTGSMAPTLLGQHIAINCTQCGYDFDFDVHRSDRIDPATGNATNALAPANLDAICPMCHYPNSAPQHTRIKAGDRILVHKYIYSLSEPRRWDVVVFKNPSDPDINFIKRLVGLPNEKLWIIDGNVYTQSLDSPDAPWHIARKSMRPKVQRDVWQPVYHSDFIPLDGGGASPQRRINGIDCTWSSPWEADQPEAWEIADRRSYDFAGGSDTIRFNFNTAADGGPGWYPYNQFSPISNEPLEDVRIAAAFEPHDAGLSVELSTTIRALDPSPNAPPLPVIARINAEGKASLTLTGPDQRIVTADASPFPVGQSTNVELWYVDQEASLWVNGQRIVTLPIDLHIDAVISRPEPALPPQIGIKVDGPAVTLHRIEVDRDLYYTSSLVGSSSMAHRGTLVKWLSDGSHVRSEGDPVTLEADQFFCLGDNSPQQ